ncbi:MAG: phosphomethylpyrimidine kinase / thiamine-phosphate pyrophosphorylase [Ramlibacter sp.]|nr:phosphomethylpyrimidine kinase / thiamine-phosphate pyrophosphorylase [Ramlibacter sp.]
MSRSELPRVVAWSIGEAQRWLGDGRPADASLAPATAARLRDAGAESVCIVDAGLADGRALTWIDTPHARGWLAASQSVTMPGGGEGRHAQHFAHHLSAAMAKGFVAADAAILASMAGADGWNVSDPARLPQLSWGEEPRCSGTPAARLARLDIYAIVDSADRLLQVLAAGVKTVQLRIKAPEAPDPGWTAALRAQVRRSITACDAAGAELFINDHWELAAQAGAKGVHLGQEDLLALGDAGRAALQATGMALGISSHSLWELCRASTLAPRYVACGPVWPTLTKAMPWRAQGLDNLAWWCRMAPAPVVAIGGILGAEQVEQAARCGADGICIVRGLGQRPQDVVPGLQAAMKAGRAAAASTGAAAGWPHPSLD